MTVSPYEYSVFVNCPFIVRDWLSSSNEAVEVPSGSLIAKHYLQFREELPDLCNTVHLDLNELIFNDYTTLVVQ